MQITINIPDDEVRSNLAKVAASVLGRDMWDPKKLSGSMQDHFRDAIERQIKAHIDTVDLSAEIAAVVEVQMLPTIREAIERELKAAARKAVKVEMEKR